LGEELDAEYDDLIEKLDFKKSNTPAVSKFANVAKVE
jgi:hypothetical protein